MNVPFKNSKAGLSALLLVSVALLATHPASASICYTSGKVYVQQKVFDKASYFLECARKGEPENVDVLSLLAFARSQQRQYKSAGAAFTLALAVATKKKDEKRAQDITRNRLAVSALLFNAGVKAMSGAQGAEPPTEGSALAAYAPPPDPQTAVTDTTVFPAFTGASRLEESAYDFVLASYVDPSSIETYQNLTYVLSGLGRTDDAILAAKTGLKVKPDDHRLLQNLRAAVMGKALKLYNDGKYAESVVEFRQAMSQDPEPSAAPGYQLRIAGAWMKLAEAAEKGSASQKAAYDSAATGFAGVLDMSAASDSLKQNAVYNVGVIYSNMGAYDKAIAVLDPGTAKYPDNKDIWSLTGQIKFQKEDYAGAETVLRHAIQLDPEDPANHQFLFLTLNKLGKPGDAKSKESINEYTIYKALTQGSKKNPKVWVDSAVNRLGASNQITPLAKTEGYPDEVYTYSEEGKNFETFFFWTKGKSVTFLDGVMFSQGAVPPKKS